MHNILAKKRETYVPKVGLLTVSLPPELSTVPAEAVRIADELSLEAENVLGRNELDVLRHSPQVTTLDEVLRAAKGLQSSGVDCIIYLLGSWIYVPMIATPMSDVTLPSVLWGVPHPILGTSVASCINHGSLDELGIKHKFIYGSPKETEVIEEIVKFAQAAMVVNRMRKLRYGLIGGRCMYMYTAEPDMIQTKSLFGVETEHIDEYKVVLEAQKVTDQESESVLKKVREEFGRIAPSTEIMLKSVKLYLALKRIIEEHKLDFLGVKCMPEVTSNYVSFCLAASLVNDEGTILACECDTNAALTMQILHLLSGQVVGFGDVFDVEKKTRVLKLINCGSFPSKLARSRKDVDIGVQYEFIGKNRGATTVFCSRAGRVTLARLARVKGEYVMQIATGEAFERPKEVFKEDRDVWPHAFVKLDGDARAFIQNCRSNHMHFVYGDFKEQLVEVCDLLHIKSVLT